VLAIRLPFASLDRILRDQISAWDAAALTAGGEGPEALRGVRGLGPGCPPAAGVG
jgi:hypothetical protein